MVEVCTHGAYMSHDALKVLNVSPQVQLGKVRVSQLYWSRGIYDSNLIVTWTMKCNDDHGEIRTQDSEISGRQK